MSGPWRNCHSLYRLKQSTHLTPYRFEVHLETQVYDYNTCEPVEGAYVEIWHCNSTGVYSGIVASGNGDKSDTTNLNKTFLRGVSVTDDEGVVTFDTLFPGHYLSRSNQ